MIESLLILFLVFALIFAFVYGVVWGACKVSTNYNAVSQRRVLIITTAISLVLIVCITVYFSNGFSDLPDQ